MRTGVCANVASSIAIDQTIRLFGERLLAEKMKGSPMDTKLQIRQLLGKNFYLPDPASLRDDTSLLEQGIIDSTGVLELVGFLEETFGISVLDNETLPENLDSIRNLTDLIERKLAEKVA